MDGQDHPVTAGSTGHEVHLCHRCGWPFPNPHPSAKHRRAHKRVCGTIEGYKTILSEEHDHHLAVSDEDQASDDEHTPSPQPVKKDVEEFGSSGGIGEISNRSEDDVFTDAVTEFSDSGVSPLSVGRSGSGLGLSKEAEPKIPESDFHGKESSKVNQTGDKIELYNDPTNKKETVNPGTLVVDANDLPRTVLPVTDSVAEAVSVGLGNSSQDNVIKPEIPREGVVDELKKCDGPSCEGIQHGERKDVQDLHILEEEQKLASANADSKEGIISDPAVIVVEKEDPCGTLVSEVVKPDLLPQTETHPNKDASAAVESAAVPETSGDNTNASIGKVSVSAEDAKFIGVADDIQPEESRPSRPSVKLAESSLPQDASKDSDATVYVKEEIEQKSSFTDVETVEKSGLVGIGIAGNNVSKAERCNADGSESGNRDSEHKASFETASKPVSADDESDREVPKREVIETVGGGSEVKVIIDSPVCTNQSNEADSSAGNVEEVSKPKSGIVTSDVEKSIQGQSSDKLNENLHSVASEYPVSQVFSEVPDNIHKPCNVGLESPGEFAVSEITPEQLISKEFTFADPELLNESFAKENRCIAKDVRESEDAKVSSEPSHDVNEAVITENSEHLPAKKCSNEISPDSEERCISEDISASKPSSFVLNAKQISESNDPTSEKCSETSSLKEVLPPSLHSQELHETSTVGNVGSTTAKSLQDECEDKLSQPWNAAMVINPSDNSSAKSESLDGNYGTVSDSLEASSAQHKTTPEEAHDKSDVFEPPSFMTLVQSSGNSDQVSTPSEIETVQNNQQPKPEDLQPGWFPSITHVVNESEGRKKNEEIIAKVTNSNPMKHHSPLKNLLSEAKTPNTVQPTAANPKHETEPVNNGTTSVAKADAPKDQDTHKHVDEWSSPARYPIETKKEKKKSKSPWVPFLCCSSRT